MEPVPPNTQCLIDLVQVVREPLHKPRIDTFVHRSCEIEDKTANQLFVNLYQVTGIRVTPQRIINRLHAAHLHARRPLVVPPLTHQHMTNRRQWCRQRRNWGNRRWARVMFLDESMRFTLDFTDGRRNIHII